jgi:hypothetical protein
MHLKLAGVESSELCLIIGLNLLPWSNEKFQPRVERSQQRREPVAVVNKKRCFDQQRNDIFHSIFIWNSMIFFD